MTAGLTVFNDNNIIQIDQDYKNQRAPVNRMIVGQTNNDFFDLAAFGLDMRIECPIVFVRSSGFVGNFQIVPANSGPAAYPRGSIQFYSETTTEVAICSTQYSPIRGNFGLEVFATDGVTLAYGSLEKYPTIFAMADLNGSSVVSSVAVPGSDSSSWWCINPITPGLSRPLGSGSDTSYPPFVHMARLSGGVMTLKFMENGFPIGPNAPNNSLSPWNGRTCRIPVARIYY